MPVSAQNPENLFMVISHAKHLLPYLQEVNVRTIEGFFGLLIVRLNSQNLSVVDLAKSGRFVKSFTNRRDQVLILLLAGSQLQKEIFQSSSEPDSEEAANQVHHARCLLAVFLLRLQEDYEDQVEVELLRRWAIANEKNFKATAHAPHPQLLTSQRRSKRKERGRVIRYLRQVLPPPSPPSSFADPDDDDDGGPVSATRPCSRPPPDRSFG